MLILFMHTLVLMREKSCKGKKMEEKLRQPGLHVFCSSTKAEIHKKDNI